MTLWPSALIEKDKYKCVKKKSNDTSKKADQVSVILIYPWPSPKHDEVDVGDEEGVDLVRLLAPPTLPTAHGPWVDVPAEALLNA